MGFVHPWALLALPLALLPFVLERVARRRGEPLPFSSLYLPERARRTPSWRAPSRARWAAVLRALALALLVLAAARPVAPGGGDPRLHLPTRAVIAVDVSASVHQRGEGGQEAWEAIRAAADSVLALAGPEDGLALAGIADGVVAWWEGPGAELRRRLATLRPSARASDWPAGLGALGSRLGKGTEAYLFTDGSRGGVGPAPSARRPAGYRALWVWPAAAGGNRALVAAPWVAPERVALEAGGWGAGVPEAAMAGRLVGDRLVDPQAVFVHRPGGSAEAPAPAGAWAVADTATFAFAEPDRFPFDDRLRVARGSAGGGYRAVRWVPPDEPPEPGTLFWEAAVAAAPRGASMERARELSGLAASPPELALLPLRDYRPDEAALLADLAAAGTRLLFAPGCPDAACVPGAGWLADADLGVPDLVWSLGPAERQPALGPRPEGGGPGVPPHLLAEIPVRGSLRPSGGAAPEIVWRLTSGAPAFWARGPVGVWLVPLGPPVTRLGTTPVFPLVADAVLAAWDPRWGAGADSRVGEPLAAPPGATVRGPLGAESERTWVVAEGGAPPRPEEPGLYRVERAPETSGVGGVRGAGETASFVAVHADPGEGDLRPVAPAVWRGAWGAAPTPPERWGAALFPRRRGPELWPWALAVATLALAAEAAVRRAEVRRERRGVRDSETS